MSGFLNRLLQRSFEPESLRVKANIPSRFEPLAGSNESLDSEEVAFRNTDAPQQPRTSALSAPPSVNSSPQITNVNVSELQQTQVTETIQIQSEANGSNEEKKPAPTPVIQVPEAKQSFDLKESFVQQIETKENFVERIVAPGNSKAAQAPTVPAILNPAPVEVPSIVAESAKTESVVKVSIGTVEVNVEGRRSEKPPAQAPRRVFNAPSKVLTLDDYLAGRTSGGKG